MTAELPAGVGRPPRAAQGHMPFEGHRTCAEWIAQQQRRAFDCWACVSRSICPFRNECPHYPERPRV